MINVIDFCNELALIYFDRKFNGEINLRVIYCCSYRLADNVIKSQNLFSKHSKRIRSYNLLLFHMNN